MEQKATVKREMEGEAMELAGKRVLVIGLGRSGRSAAQFCVDRGARVVAADARPLGDLADLGELGGNVEICAGGPLPDPADFDLVVPSPGVPRAHYAERATCVMGDIELAGLALQVPIVAVTGTNGKSTTVVLIEAMLRACGLRAMAAGNLGRPALDLVGEALDVAVLEVSSFQLEAVDRFRPRVSLVLNLSPDHLDRHGDFAAYVDAKRAIFRNQQGDDVVVLNHDDPTVRELAAEVRGRVLFFSRRTPLVEGVSLDGGSVLLRQRGESRRLTLDGLRLQGNHNLENVLAALAAVQGLGADPAQAVKALVDFRGLAHRCEPVGTVDGVTFINDSKATNVGAAQRSLEGFSQPLVWIAGGRDKGLDFSPLAEAAAGRVKTALLLGEAAPQLESALADRVAVEQVASLEEAVERAAQLAAPGELVLLSPACASFDQFADFEERGECFRNAVAKLRSASKSSESSPPRSRNGEDSA
jgi:UDP-N-acetylmuramoylalanine--D-glutamate ligase